MSNETLQWTAIIILLLWTVVQYIWMRKASKLFHGMVRNLGKSRDQ